MLEQEFFFIVVSLVECSAKQPILNIGGKALKRSQGILKETKFYLKGVLIIAKKPKNTKGNVKTLHLYRAGNILNSKALVYVQTTLFGRGPQLHAVVICWSVFWRME